MDQDHAVRRRRVQDDHPGPVQGWSSAHRV